MRRRRGRRPQRPIYAASLCIPRPPLVRPLIALTERSTADQSCAISAAAAEILKIKAKAPQGRICGNEIIGQPASVDGDFTGDLAAPCAAS